MLGGGDSDWFVAEALVPSAWGDPGVSNNTSGDSKVKVRSICELLTTYFSSTAQLLST